MKPIIKGSHVTAAFTVRGSGSIGFCLVLQAHPPLSALYAISVRRFGTLPSASFRFHLTMDTLAVRQTLPTAKRVADFHRQVIAHVGVQKMQKRSAASAKKALITS